MENAYNVTLYNEDYTMGKVLENMMYSHFFIKDKMLSYVSLKKNHPQDKDSILMLAYNDKGIKNENIVENIIYVSNFIIEVYQKIKSNMRKV